MEKKKNNILFVVIFLIFLIIGFVVGYFVSYNYFSDDLGNENKNDVKEEAVNDDLVKELYNSLIIKDSYYGLYFVNDVDINTLTAEEIMPYVMLKYAEENNITLPKYDLQCISSSDELDGCKDEKQVSVSKEQIDNYINKMFNTQKSFELKSNSDGNYYLSLFGHESYGFLYDVTNKIYYYGFIPTSGNSVTIHNEYIKSEQVDEDIYIYDRAFVSDSSAGSVSFKKGLNSYDDIFWTGYWGTGDYDKYISSNTNGIVVKTEVVFQDFDSKINNYKHTFKKASDGKYYWFSSKIVK